MTDVHTTAEVAQFLASNRVALLVAFRDDAAAAAFADAAEARKGGRGALPLRAPRRPRRARGAAPARDGGLDRHGRFAGEPQFLEVPETLGGSASSGSPPAPRRAPAARLERAPRGRRPARCRWRTASRPRTGTRSARGSAGSSGSARRRCRSSFSSSARARPPTGARGPARRSPRSARRCAGTGRGRPTPAPGARRRAHGTFVELHAFWGVDVGQRDAPGAARPAGGAVLVLNAEGEGRRHQSGRQGEKGAAAERAHVDVDLESPEAVLAFLDAALADELPRKAYTFRSDEEVEATVELPAVGAVTLPLPLARALKTELTLTGAQFFVFALTLLAGLSALLIALDGGRGPDPNPAARAVGPAALRRAFPGLTEREKTALVRACAAFHGAERGPARCRGPAWRSRRPRRGRRCERRSSRCGRCWAAWRPSGSACPTARRRAARRRHTPNASHAEMLRRGAGWRRCGRRCGRPGAAFDVLVSVASAVARRGRRGRAAGRRAARAAGGGTRRFDGRGSSCARRRRTAEVAPRRSDRRPGSEARGDDKDPCAAATAARAAVWR